MRLALAASVLLCCAIPAGADEPDAQTVARGKLLYTQNHCQLCHSVGGVGNAKGPHDGVGARLSPAEIKDWLLDPRKMAEKAKAERKPPMIPFSALPSEDIDALVAYVSSLKTPRP